MDTQHPTARVAAYPSTAQMQVLSPIVQGLLTVAMARFLPIAHDTHGPLAIPKMAKAASITVNGSIVSGATNNFGVIYFSNITSLELPDLETITSSFIISHVSSISSINVPKLRNVNESLKFDLSDGPAIKLSFPSLSYARNISLTGNIDE